MSRRWHAPCAPARCEAAWGRSRGVESGRQTQEGIAMFASILAVAQRPRSRPWVAATAAVVLGLLGAPSAKAADDTIKIGILHSLSGTMAISETTLKDVMLMLIDEQNKKGGVLGKKLE